MTDTTDTMTSDQWSLPAVASPDVDLPVIDDVDVVVVGGGAAGVAAATTVAESGRSVVLIERYGFCGGAAVAGMSGTICGLYLASERVGRPEQVVFGFAERFRQELETRGGLTQPQAYGKTWTVAHDPLVWREAADFLLARAGVRVLFHTTMTGVLLDGDRHRGVVVDSTAGRGLVLADRTIDASGDGSVAARSGHRFVMGDHGRIQNPTMFFRLANVDVPRFRAAFGQDSICPPWVTAAIDAYEQATLPRNKIFVFESPRPHELLVNATRLVGPAGRMLDVVDPADFTYAETAGRRQVRDYAGFLVATVPGCEAAYVVDTGVEVGIRQTRTICGTEWLTNDDVVTARKRTDAICRSPWPIELHDGSRPRLEWLLDDFYEIPYRTLVPEAFTGIIAAGRCLSAQHEALASARVTAQCFEYGHAAGIATVVSLADGEPSYDKIDVQRVRDGMAAGGSRL